MFYQVLASALHEARALSGLICNIFEGLEESELSRLHHYFRVGIMTHYWNGDYTIGMVAILLKMWLTIGMVAILLKWWLYY